MRHETRAWCGMNLRVKNRQQKCVPKTKIVLLMLYYIDKNWYHFIKEYLELFSKFAFQEVASPVRGPNRHILEILLTRRHTLVAKTIGRVLGYTNSICFICAYLFRPKQIEVCLMFIFVFNRLPQLCFMLVIFELRDLIRAKVLDLWLDESCTQIGLFRRKSKQVRLRAFLFLKTCNF